MTTGRGDPIGLRPIATPGLERESDAEPVPSAVPGQAGRVSPGPGIPARSPHVVVRDGGGALRPGLVVEQARDEHGRWVVLVVCVVVDEHGAASTVQGWVDASTVRPA